MIAFAFLFSQRRGYGFAIDEATYVWVVEQERQWFQQIGERGLGASLASDSIDRRLHFLEAPYSKPGQPHSNFNLPFAFHLMALVSSIADRWVDELTALRLTSMLLVSALVGISAYVMGCRYGPWAGAATAMAVLLQPRLIGHGHLATTESALGTCWTLALLSAGSLPNDANTRRGAWIVRTSLLVGLAMAVKLTAWILPVVIAAWLLTERPKAGGWLLAALAFVPIITVVALTPPLWHRPLAGLIDYVRAALANPWKIVGVHGGIGSMGPAPISSGPLLAVTTAPIGILALALLGMLHWRDSLARLFSMSALAILAQRTFNLMPTHDGERQFLPLFYSLAILAGVGVGATTVTWVQGSFWRRIMAGALVAAAFIEPLIDAWTYRRHGLMYYNRLIGGLAGAARHGEEISYYFEAMTDDDWREALILLPPNARVFLRPDHPGLDELARRGCWRRDLIATGPSEADYWLLYGKRAAYYLPDEQGRVQPTRLWQTQQKSDGLMERQFQGVRWLTLIRNPNKVGGR